VSLRCVLLRMIVSNIFLAVWDAALKIMVLMSLALNGIKVRREAELMRSTSWPAKACVRCSLFSLI